MSYEQRIIQMRKGGAGITVLTREIISFNSNLDEIVCLANVLRIINKNNLAVSQKEVRTAFNKFYNKSYHGDKISYLSWLYKTFHIKIGAVVQTYKSRAVPSKKDSLAVISGGISGSNSHDFAKDELRQGKSPSPKILALNGGNLE